MPEYRIVIPGWLPTSLSTLGHCHWRVRQRAKEADAEVIASAFLGSGVPRVRVAAAGRKFRKQNGLPAAFPFDPAPVRRRVRLEITLAKGERARDQDNVAKTLLDGLKLAGYLFDDSPRWCEFCLPFPYTRGGENRTAIILEDIPPYVMPREKRARPGAKVLRTKIDIDEPRATR